MKLIFPIIFLLALSLPVMAGITVEADKQLYNLGDFVVASYSISTDSDFSGLTRLSLACTNFTMDFYALPTSLFAGQSQSATVPGLGIVPAMDGKCYIDANASSFDKTISYSSVSGFFNVTGSIPVSVKAEKSVFLPGEEINVAGVVAKSHASKASVALSFLDSIYSAPVVNNSFSYIIRLPADVKSGKHSLDFSVNDSYGNSGSSSFDFIVEAVPTKLSLILSNRTALPREIVRATVELYDQGGDAMGRQASVSLIDSAGNVALHGSNTTPALFRLELPSSIPPGTYLVEASSSGLTATSTLFVEAVEGISVSFDERMLTVINSGNIDYNRELIINLSGTNKQLLLSQELELQPGQSTIIDLYKEAPEDDYMISFPEISDAPSYESHLEDERSAVRKASDFMGITGRIVQQTGTPGIQTITAPLLLVVIVGLLIFFFARNRGKPSADDSRDAETELQALKQQLDEKRQEKEIKEAESQLGQMNLPPGLSRDDESVRKFLENMKRNKQI